MAKREINKEVGTLKEALWWSTKIISWLCRRCEEIPKEIIVLIEDKNIEHIRLVARGQTLVGSDKD